MVSQPQPGHSRPTHKVESAGPVPKQAPSYIRGGDGKSGPADRQPISYISFGVIMKLIRVIFWIFHAPPAYEYRYEMYEWSFFMSTRNEQLAHSNTLANTAIIERHNT